MLLEDDFDLALAVNLKAPFFTVRRRQGHEMRQVGGRIHQQWVPKQVSRPALPGDPCTLHDKSRPSLPPHQMPCRRWGKQTSPGAVRLLLSRLQARKARWAKNPEFRYDVIERIAGLHRIG